MGQVRKKNGVSIINEKKKSVQKVKNCVHLFLHRQVACNDGWHHLFCKFFKICIQVLVIQYGNIIVLTNEIADLIHDFLRFTTRVEIYIFFVQCGRVALFHYFHRNRSEYDCRRVSPSIMFSNCKESIGMTDC